MEKIVEQGTDATSLVTVKNEEIPIRFRSAKSVYDSLKKSKPSASLTIPCRSKRKKKKPLKRSISNGKVQKMSQKSENNIDSDEVALDIESSSNCPSENDEPEESFQTNGDEPVPSDVSYQTLDNIDYHIIDSTNALIFIPFHTCVYVKGHFNAKVLNGNAEVLGYTLEEDPEKIHSIYSPRGYSLLCIRSLRRNSPTNKSPVLGLQKSGLDCDQNLLKSKSSTNTILLLQSQNWRTADYINRLFPSNILRRELCAPLSWNQEDRNAFEDLCSKLNISLILQGATFKARFYEQPDIWKMITQQFLDLVSSKEYFRLLFCGGKGVGKSTLLRYTVNRLLKECGSVLVLDFDPGQPEFVPSGCVSATLVSTPLLGPNFTHLQESLYCYFVGDVDITVDPNRYVQSCIRLLNDCRMQPKLMSTPMIINTMGFTTGIGMDVMLDVIRLSQPTHVIQLTSGSSRRNFAALLEHSYVTQESRGWMTDFTANTSPEYKFEAISSAAENTERSMEQWGFRASELRNIGLVSYFSRLSTGVEWTLTDAVPYKISWKNIAICISNESVEPALTMAALNASLVALCVLDAETGSSVARYQATGFPTILAGAMPVMPCLGYAVVRAVDYTNRLIYLLSPEAIDRVSRVNCLVLGGIHLPEAMVLDAPSALRKHHASGNGPKTRVPYATFGPSAIQPTCLPIKKYNPLFTVRGWTQV